MLKLIAQLLEIVLIVIRLKPKQSELTKFFKTSKEVRT